jgi:hypothetical protein
MGFKNGLRRCNQLLKNKGYLVITEAVLLSHNIPEPLKKFWNKGYPDIKDLKNNLSLIQKEGFDLIFHFTLPKSSWIDNYYSPMEKRIQELKKKYHNNKIALQVFEECEKEIKVFHKYPDYFGYEFFIKQKNQDNSS